MSTEIATLIMQVCAFGIAVVVLVEIIHNNHK
jgi:hypothetical protein